MTKVRALNKDGQITWCTAKVPGHGNCNHLLHLDKLLNDKNAYVRQTAQRAINKQ